LSVAEIYVILARNLKRGYHCGETGVDGRTILKWISKKQDADMHRIHLARYWE
jgi:hypothetical protein